jgi:hypothetical protein
MPNWYAGITFPIDPDATLPYTMQWADWLPPGRSIESHQIIPGGQITIAGHSRQGSDITIWVTGVPEGERASATFRVTTDGDMPITDDRTVYFRGTQR